MSMSIAVAGMFGGGGRKERRSMSVAEARPYLEEAETERQFPQRSAGKGSGESYVTCDE